MKKTLFTAVSAAALMMTAGPALAENTTMNDGTANDTPQHTERSFSEDAKKAWKNTKEDVSEAAEKVSDATKETYNDAKNALTNDNDNEATLGSADFDSRTTAQGMLGQPVLNAQGERVAKVEDIILDQNGDAVMVVLVDGDFTGLGKQVAFDYDLVTTRSAEGDILASLTEEMIDQAASFSYEASSDNNVKVMPNNGYSISKILDSRVVGPNNETLADVDNIVLRNGSADQIVVSFDQILGFGGKQAALSYSDADLRRNGDNLEFNLSANEAEQLKNYKKSRMN